MPAETLVSTPMKDVQGNFIDTANAFPRAGFGFVEKLGQRPSQEDAVFYKKFDKNFFDKLNPINIAHRLWTAVHCLDKQGEAGSTASITAYNGQNTFVTATLGDSTAFVAVYGKDGQPLRARRLHDMLHNAKDSVSECDRIEASGGSISFKRVDGHLAVTRALGDTELRSHGVTADATIDIWTIEQLCEDLKIDANDIGKIQLIVACDGFTEKLKNGQKKTQEDFLLDVLRISMTDSECTLAANLAYRAIKLGSNDNVSVAIQTITQDTEPFVVGVFDGHSGKKVSSFAARWLGLQFERLCALDEKQYALEEEFSVPRNQACYDRDNKITEEKFLNHQQKISSVKQDTDATFSEEVKPIEESTGSTASITKQKLLKALKAYLNEELFNSIDKENAHKVLLLLQEEIGLKNYLNTITPDMLNMLIQYSDSVQRMVIDADCPLSSLLKLNATELEAIFQNEYVVYCLRKANWPLEKILPMLGNLAYLEEFQHISSFLYLKNSLEPYLEAILINASPSMRQELYEHALEISLIAKDLLNELPEKNKDQAFLDHLFGIADAVRQERYQKIWLTKALFEEGCLHYQDLPMIDFPLFQELNLHERVLIELSQSANIAIPEFVALTPLRRNILVSNADKIDTMATYQTFTWQEFFDLPKDIVDMDGGQQQQLGWLFKDKVLTKQSFLAFSPEERNIIIDKESELRVFHEAGINLNEILSFNEEFRHDVCYFSHTICRLMKDKSYSPELIKTRLFELLKSNNSAYYKLLVKVRDGDPEGTVLFNNLMSQTPIQNAEPVNATSTMKM